MQILIGVALLIAQGVLIAGLLLERRTWRRAQAKLSDAEERYRTVTDFTATLEYWMTPDGAFVYVSPSCLQITGYAREEFMRRPELMAELLVEEDRQAWLSHHHAVSPGAAPLAFESRIRSKHGEVKWIDVVLSPVASSAGEHRGVRGSVRDITTKKQSEEELRRALDDNRKLRDQLEIDNTDLREEIERGSARRHALSRRDRPAAARFPQRDNGGRQTMEEFQREHIRTTLQTLHWRVEGPGGAAEVLGMNASTLRSRMRKLGIRRPGSASASVRAS